MTKLPVQNNKESTIVLDERFRSIDFFLSVRYSSYLGAMNFEIRNFFLSQPVDVRLT